MRDEAPLRYIVAKAPVVKAPGNNALGLLHAIPHRHIDHARRDLLQESLDQRVDERITTNVVPVEGKCTYN